MKQEKILEALLFASGEAVHISRLADTLGCDASATRNILWHMGERYVNEAAGLMLIEMEDSFQLCVNPEYNDYVHKMVQTSPKKTLTQPLMETLSIIAFKQPVTKSVIEDIRGVNADHAVNKLLEYGLVMEKGRLDAPGRPILFGTTDGFLKFYGLKSLDDLLDGTKDLMEVGLDEAMEIPSDGAGFDDGYENNEESEAENID